jgi:hypothetical protein
MQYENRAATYALHYHLTTACLKRQCRSTLTNQLHTYTADNTPVHVRCCEVGVCVAVVLLLHQTVCALTLLTLCSSNHKLL